MRQSSILAIEPLQRPRGWGLDDPCIGKSSGIKAAAAGAHGESFYNQHLHYSFATEHLFRLASSQSIKHHHDSLIHPSCCLARPRVSSPVCPRRPEHRKNERFSRRLCASLLVDPNTFSTCSQFHALNPGNQFYMVQHGDTCWDIVSQSQNTFTMNQLLCWNPDINPWCSNLIPGRNVCIGVVNPGLLC